MPNLFDNMGFTWWTGVVEDRNDPLQVGRCRVRIVGYHTKDTSVLPTADLPWAIPAQPITSAALSGIGESPTGMVEGTWVWGFFSDGDDAQEPIICGTLGGIPQSAYFASLKASDGFRDPSHHYPLPALLDEPSTNRLARGVRTGTIVPLKDAGRAVAVPLATGLGVWSEPPSAFGAVYPYNHVKQTESGHTVEFDDTPNAERIHEYHRSGTFTETDRNGTVVNRIVGEKYEIFERNGFIYIRGSANVTVEGNINIYAKNDCNVQVDGNLETQVHGDYKLNVGGNIDVVAGGNMAIKTKGAMGWQALSVYIEAAKFGALKSPLFGFDVPVMPLSIFTINPFLAQTESALSLADSGLLTLPSPIISVPPTPVTLPPLGFTLSASQQQSFAIEKIQAFAQADDPLTSALGKVVAMEYGNLKTDELTSNMLVSSATTFDSTALDNTPSQYKCTAGVRVVQAAEAYLGVTETDNQNYGGKVGGGTLPAGTFGVIDAMLELCGLDNPTQWKETSLGFPWCGAFATYAWQAAGLVTPQGSASCANWETWAKANGLFSSTPKIGAVILYGSASAHHCGIVASVGVNGSITTIEGNTVGGTFTSEGCTVASKTPRTYRGFVIPPTCI